MHPPETDEQTSETPAPVGQSQWLGEYRRKLRGDGDGGPHHHSEPDHLENPGRLGD
ncbi:MAG: hypothetical protein AAB511_03510 [Patescibacteria group bacterium]